MESELKVGESSELKVGESSERVPPHIEVLNQRQRSGIPMIEVSSVCILNLPGSATHLYGRITLTGGTCSSYLYNRKREESESYCLGQNVLLSGPTFSVLAFDSIYIDVDLVDRDDADAVIPDPRSDYCYDAFLWDSNIYYDFYDQPLYKKVKGKYCSVGVTYIVFEDGVQATVNATLIIQDPKHTPNVFGLITASNSNFPDEEDQSVLFQKASHEHIGLRPGQLIPLSRSVVSVPLNSVLIIQADLQDCQTGVIAKGTAKFPANLSGKFFEERIRGNGSEIQVKVGWTGDSLKERLGFGN